MPAQPHKRRVRAGQKGLLIGVLLSMMGLILMVLGSAWMGPPPVEPAHEARKLAHAQGDRCRGSRPHG